MITLLRYITPNFISSGYVEAAVIPEGARSITISESKPCTSFLGEFELWTYRDVHVTKDKPYHGEEPCY